MGGLQVTGDTGRISGIPISPFRSLAHDVVRGFVLPHPPRCAASPRGKPTSRGLKPPALGAKISLQVDVSGILSQ